MANILHGVDKCLQIRSRRLVYFDDAATGPKTITRRRRPITEIRNVHAIGRDAPLRSHCAVRILDQCACPGNSPINTSAIQRRRLDRDLFYVTVSPDSDHHFRLLYGVLQFAERRYYFTIDGQHHVTILQEPCCRRSRNEARDAQRPSAYRVVFLETFHPVFIYTHLARGKQRRIDELCLK